MSVSVDLRDPHVCGTLEMITNTITQVAFIPMYRRDTGILTPNAAVLIAIFASRLSAGWGCHVCQVRWGRKRKG